MQVDHSKPQLTDGKLSERVVVTSRDQRGSVARSIGVSLYTCLSYRERSLKVRSFITVTARSGSSSSGNWNWWWG